MKNQKNVGWVRPKAVTHQDKTTVPENAPIPFSWELVPLKELGQWSGGGTPSKAKPEYWEKGKIPWVSPKDMKMERIIDSEDHITKAAVEESTAKLISAGSVLIVTRSGILSHTLPVAVTTVPVTVNQDLKALTPKEGILPEYVAWALRSFARDILNTCSKQGTTVNSIETAALHRFEIPVAPLDQQKRIVAEIEKQFSRLDEGVANLKRVKANLKRYKAAVLKAAVEGRLVETEAEIARREGRSLPTPRPGVFYVYAIRCNDDSIYIGHTDDLARRWEEHLAGQAADWTKQHKPVQIVHYEEYPSRQEAADREKWLKTGYGRKWIKREINAGRARPACAPRAGKQVGYETGEQLLQRILETRRQQWLARAEQAGGKGKGKYKEPVAPDTTDLPDLPEGWVWARLDAIAALKGGITVDSTRKDPTARSVPYLRVANVQRGYLDFSEVKFIDAPESDIRELRLQRSDILFNEGGDRDKLGRGWIWEGQLPDCIHQNHVFRARLVLSELSPKLVSWWGNSFGKDYFLREGKQTTNLASINLTKLSAFPVPLPPAAEQQRLVAEVDRHLSLVTEIESQVNTNLTRAERLRQSILSRAFSGLFVLRDGTGTQLAAIQRGA